MDIKSEFYTDDKKAYLTYDPQPAAKSRLLKEDKQILYTIYLNGDMIQTLHDMTQKTKQALEESGFEIKENRHILYSGINSFTTSKGEKIPVTVRKLQHKGILKQIRVRITGKTHEELMDRTYAIRDTLAAYGLKHKLCVWDRTGNI